MTRILLISFSAAAAADAAGTGPDGHRCRGHHPGRCPMHSHRSTTRWRRGTAGLPPAPTVRRAPGRCTAWCRSDSQSALTGEATYSPAAATATDANGTTRKDANRIVHSPAPKDHVSQYLRTQLHPGPHIRLRAGRSPRPRPNVRHPPTIRASPIAGDFPDLLRATSPSPDARPPYTQSSSRPTLLASPTASAREETPSLR